MRESSRSWLWEWGCRVTDGLLVWGGVGLVGTEDNGGESRGVNWRKARVGG